MVKRRHNSLSRCLTEEPASASEAEKRRVASASLLAAVLLTGLKIAVGLATDSIGVLSEAAHSSLDLLAAAMTLWAVRASARPADRRHPYGHGKIENFSALFETGLLLATCAWIAYEAAKRLLFEEAHVAPTPWAFAILAASIAVDVSRSRALARAARKHNSQALEADALHFSTDVWSSSVVIAGLALVWLGRRCGLPWLVRADALAALGVAAVSLVVGLRLGKKSVDDLLDTAPAGLVESITRSAAVAGVISVIQVRVRRSGPHAFADVIIQVRRELSIEAAHEIAHACEHAIRIAAGIADVVVHAEPADAENPSAPRARVEITHPRP